MAWHLDTVAITWGNARYVITAKLRHDSDDKRRGTSLFY